MAPKATKPAAKGTKERSMLIKGINAKTWQAFKTRAAKDGRQVNWLFHNFINTYAAGQ